MTKKMRYAAIGGVCTALILCFGLFLALGMFLKSLGVNSTELNNDKVLSKEILEFLADKYNESFTIDGKINDSAFQVYPSTNNAIKFCVTVEGDNFNDNYQTVLDTYNIKDWLSAVMLNDFYCTVTQGNGEYRVVVTYTGALNTSLFNNECNCANFTMVMYEVTEEELFNIKSANGHSSLNARGTYKLKKRNDSFSIEDLR